MNFNGGEKKMWYKLRNDEYILDNNIFRMTKEKERIIREFDRRVFDEKRYV